MMLLSMMRDYFDKNQLVNIRDYGLLGSNFYWHKYARHGLSKEDIMMAGVVDDSVYVHKDIISALVKVDQELQKRAWKLYIKEGYRSKELYEIVYQRRVEKYGKNETDSIFNMEAMPHARGMSLDVALWDVSENSEVYMRNGEDGTPALFIDYYKERTDADSKYYQELQEYVIDIMLDQGFQIGTKREYFHFDYRPKEPKNYK